MIEDDILHLVVALRVGKRVVGLAEMPFAGEEGLVAPVLRTEASVHSAAGSPPPWPWKATVVMPLRLGMRPVCMAARPGVQLGWA